VPVARATLVAASWLRRHGDRTRPLVPHRPRAELLSSRHGAPALLAAPRGAPMSHGALAVGEALRRRAAVADAELDHVFPDELRDRSHLH